jgi:tetratricopeptide (TPR) repeat protein
VLHAEIKETPSFTGRANELSNIGDALRLGDTATITQPAAVHGLGGVGKSTLARQYAYQERDRYAGVWWLNAARAKDSKSWEGIEKGLVDLGSIFIRGLDQAADRVKAARQTLEFIAGGGFAKPWLLVYDNVDDAAVLRQWAPVGNARLLVTTRLRAWGAGIAKVEVEEWPMAEAVSYLLKESGRGDLTAANVEAIATALGGLPLALSHAAAYLRENENATAEAYLAAITRHLREAPESADYHRAVFATFQEQVEQAEARTPGARGVISLAAFYAPDDIAEELFTQAAEYYPAPLARVVADPVKLEKAIGALIRFSLIDFVAETRTFSIHRLVQSAARDALAKEAPHWARSALLAAWAAFPEPEFNTWPACERLASHVRAVASHVATDSRELYWLVTAAGTYLQERAATADVLPLYQRGLAIADRLAKSDPGNAGWQRDLSISQEKIGDVLGAQGNLPAALDSYKASLAIRDRLAKSDPGNAGWQRDLSVAHNKIGDVLGAQGNLPAALDSYKASLAIRGRLAKSDPGNAGWQRDLALSHGRVGMIEARQGASEDALEGFREGREIIARLRARSPDNATLPNDLAWFDALITALERY